ncbi:hypothetical protein DMP15_29505 [Pseudonocardia sp. UM4_GMWB1]|jgi:hypothetical protein|uniref:hypothetical protein n=1 Tax=Pseudonocardia sp. UM4_GMWB1 TaxID=2212989 RepID=UPI00307F518E
MPTIDIETAPALSGRERRGVAVRLTRWLTDRGVTAAHVIVRFATAEPSAIHSGGLPIETLARGDGLHHATVVCRIAPDRDREFRDGLAHALAEALHRDERTALFTVEFRVTDPSEVYLGSGSELRQAATIATGGHT